MLTKSRTIVITGISRGIGFQLARILCEQGHRVIGTGRTPAESLAGFVPHAIADSENKLHRINFRRTNEGCGSSTDGHGVTCDYVQCDLSDQCQTDEFVCLLNEQVEQIDMLIHNAAIGYYGPLAQQEDLDALVASNSIAPILLTRALSKLLMTSRQPKVVFISSAHSLWPTTEFSAYVASKCALEGFARSLQVEWRGKAQVQVLFPGATATSMHQSAGVPEETIASFKRVDDVAMAKRIADAVSRSASWRALYFKDGFVRYLSRIALPILCLRNVWIRA